MHGPQTDAQIALARVEQKLAWRRGRQQLSELVSAYFPAARQSVHILRSHIGAPAARHPAAMRE